MSKVSIFDFSEMPLYLVQTRQTENNSPIDISNELAEWVNQKNETGKLGENIALQYLLTKFKAVQPALNDSYGYDIQAGDQYFEVKTSTAKDHFFIISSNEIKTADKFNEKYHIFYILLDRQNTQATGFIIDNPLNSFQITQSELLTTIQKEGIKFSPIAFKILLGNFLDSRGKIDLSEVYRKLLKQQT